MLQQAGIQLSVIFAMRTIKPANVLTKIDPNSPLCVLNAKKIITIGIVPTKLITPMIQTQVPQAPLAPNMLLCSGYGVGHLYKDYPMRPMTPTLDTKTTSLNLLGIERGQHSTQCPYMTLG